MTTIITTCPLCRKGLDRPVDRSAVDADAFCPHCDLPMFWAPATVSVDGAAASGADDDEPAEADPRRRQPEVKGVRSPVVTDCWNCGEPNEPTATRCHRCSKGIPRSVESSHEAPPDEVPDPPVRRELKPYPDVPAWVLVALGALLAVMTVYFLVKV